MMGCFVQSDEGVLKYRFCTVDYAYGVEATSLLINPSSNCFYFHHFIK